MTTHPQSTAKAEVERLMTLGDLAGTFPVTLHRDLDADDFWYAASTVTDGKAVMGEWKRSAAQAFDSLLKQTPNVFGEYKRPPGGKI